MLVVVVVAQWTYSTHHPSLSPLGVGKKEPAGTAAQPALQGGGSEGSNVFPLN